MPSAPYVVAKETGRRPLPDAEVERGSLTGLRIAPCERFIPRDPALEVERAGAAAAADEASGTIPKRLGDARRNLQALGVLGDSELGGWTPPGTPPPASVEALLASSDTSQRLSDAELDAVMGSDLDTDGTKASDSDATKTSNNILRKLLAIAALKSSSGQAADAELLLHKRVGRTVPRTPPQQGSRAAAVPADSDELGELDELLAMVSSGPAGAEAGEHPAAAASAVAAADIPGLDGGRKVTFEQSSPDLDADATGGPAARVSRERDLENRRDFEDLEHESGSHWRDCHSAAPPSTFSRFSNSDGERASPK